MNYNPPEPIEVSDAGGVILTLLPGPDRKRTNAVYRYHVRYRNHDPAEPGCLMTWEVLGGREGYQISLERTSCGTFRWHCTCADAIYRGDDDHRHRCKHVRGLTTCIPTFLEAEPAIIRRSA